MARVRYTQGCQIGGQHITITRTENMAEDWTWRTVKLVGFFIGSFAVLWWIFNGGRMFEYYFPTARTATTTTSKPPKVTTPPVTVRVVVPPIKVEVVPSTPPPPSPQPRFGRAW